jgi:hypothetical protein
MDSPREKKEKTNSEETPTVHPAKANGVAASDCRSAHQITIFGNGIGDTSGMATNRHPERDGYGHVATPTASNCPLNVSTGLSNLGMGAAHTGPMKSMGVSMNNKFAEGILEFLLQHQIHQQQQATHLQARQQQYAMSMPLGSDATVLSASESLSNLMGNPQSIHHHVNNSHPYQMHHIQQQSALEWHQAQQAQAAAEASANATAQSHNQARLLQNSLASLHQQVLQQYHHQQCYINSLNSIHPQCAGEQQAAHYNYQASQQQGHAGIPNGMTVDAQGQLRMQVQGPESIPQYIPMDPLDPQLSAYDPNNIIGFHMHSPSPVIVPNGLHRSLSVQALPTLPVLSYTQFPPRFQSLRSCRRHVTIAQYISLQQVAAGEVNIGDQLAHP